MGATFITDTNVKLAELDERARAAWFDYNAGLKGLEGQEYEEAESRSWERLQMTLGELEAERARLALTTSAS